MTAHRLAVRLPIPAKENKARAARSRAADSLDTRNPAFWLWDDSGRSRICSEFPF